MARLSSWLAAVFFIAYLVLGYFYLKQRAEMALIRAESTEASSRDQQSRRQAVEFKEKLAAADASARKAEEELAAQDHAATARTQAPVSVAGNRGGRMLDLLRDPAYQALEKKQTRRFLLRQYGDALASLNLPPDQLAQLKDLLISRSFSTGDPRLAGLEPGTPAFAQAMRAAGQAVTQQIDALIGPEGQRKLQNAQMLTVAQNQVNNSYAPDFAEAGIPLTADQSSGLAQLLNPLNNTVRGAGSNQADPETWLTPRDEKLLEQAAQVLSPAQVEILKGDRAEQNQRQALMRQYMGGAAAVQTSGGTTIVP